MRSGKWGRRGVAAYLVGDGADLVDRAGRHIQARGKGLVVLRLPSDPRPGRFWASFNAWSVLTVVHRGHARVGYHLAFSDQGARASGAGLTGRRPARLICGHVVDRKPTIAINSGHHSAAAPSNRGPAR